MKMLVGVLMLALFLFLSSVQAQPPLTSNITIAAIKLSNPRLNQTSTTNGGLVEVQLDDGGPVWGSICAKNRQPWEVNIICQMMGYQDGQQTLQGTYGVGSKNYLLENMTCPVGATSLDNCTHYLIKTCGPQDNELYVTCNPTRNGGGQPLVRFKTPAQQPGYPSLQIPAPVLYNRTLDHVCQYANQPINVRIFSGAGNDTYGMGYVQLFQNGRWVFICQNKWDQAAAIVACREMCFSSLQAAANFVPVPGIVRNYVPDPTNPPIDVSEVSCIGNESSIYDCRFDRNAGPCLQSTQPTLAGVQCLPQNNTKVVIPFPDVTCGSAGLSAIFLVSKFPYITRYNVDFLPAIPASCVNKFVNSTVFSISVSVVDPQCGTILTDNTTHITYENTIRYVWLNNNLKSYQYINQRYRLICSIPKSNTVTNRYQPYTLSPLHTIYGQYDFSLQLQLYTSSTFQTQVAMIGGTYLVEVGDWINAAVVMQSTDPRLKVVTVECDALPVLPMATTVPVEKLIHNKCPSHPSLSMYEIDNFKQGFRFQAILFAGYSMAYIKCTATVCLAADPSCMRMCGTPNGTPNGRRKRQADDKSVDSQVQSMNILFYNSQSQDFQTLKSQLTSSSDTPVESISPDHPHSVTDQPPMVQPDQLKVDELQVANYLNTNSASSVGLNSLITLFSIFTILLKLIC